MNPVLRSMLTTLQAHSALVGGIVAAATFALLILAELVRPWRGRRRWTGSHALEIIAAPAAIALVVVIVVRFVVVH